MSIDSSRKFCKSFYKGGKSSFVKNTEGGLFDVYSHNFANRPDPSAAGCNPKLATQPQLGLWPQRRIGLGRADLVDPRATGQDLAIAQKKKRAYPRRVRSFCLSIEANRITYVFRWTRRH